MKLHWGHGIAAVVGVFMIAILGFVAYTLGFRNDLVVERYYDAEIQYQTHIDKLDRTTQLGSALSIELSGKGVEVRFPEEHRNKKLTGMIALYRPDDKLLDRQVPIGPDSSGLQLIPARLLRPGLWRVKVDWRAGQHSYYSEKSIFLTDTAMR